MQHSDPCIIPDMLCLPLIAVNQGNPFPATCLFDHLAYLRLIGVLADKEHEQMLQIMLPLAWKVYTVTPFHKRAMDGQALAKEASKYHQKVRYCPNMEEAVSSALKSAEKEQMSMILAFGSLSYLKELRETLKEKCII